MKAAALILATVMLAGCAATITHPDGTVARVPWPMQYAQTRGNDAWFIAPSDRSVDAATTVALTLAHTVPEALLATAERAAAKTPQP